MMELFVPSYFFRVPTRYSIYIYIYIERIAENLQAVESTRKADHVRNVT